MILPLKPSRSRSFKVQDAMYGEMERSMSSNSNDFDISKNDETCSVTSVTSLVSLESSTSLTNENGTVRFNPNAEILCEDDRTPREIRHTWLGPLPILEAREEVRHLSLQYLQQPEYKKAIEYLRIRLGSCNGSYTIVDLDEECPDDEELKIAKRLRKKLPRSC